ncbi:MAG TPA: hypothetical protein PKA37_10705, partial [Planctomycetota bacterium]|nr:hypothetical protein [Planctomycetota bacterium]
AAAGSLNDLLALARWCQAQGLTEERREVAQMVVEGDRENEEANAILGRFRYSGEWYTREAIRDLGALDSEDRLVGTEEHRRSLSRAFLLLLERPPLEREFYGALKLPLARVLDEILESEDHWRTFVEDILDRFLTGGGARALPGAFDSLITELARGEKTFADAFQIIAASPGVGVLYSSPGEFAQKVMDVFLGPGAAADAERLTSAIEMIGGERTAVFGERGSSKKDFLSIVSKQPAFYRRQLRVETERILGETLERKDLTRSAMTLAANPASFRDIRKAWVQEALRDPSTPRSKSSRQFARSLWVEVTQTLPNPDSAFLTELLRTLNTPEEMRRILPLLLENLGYLSVPDQLELSDAAYTADAFRRVLRRNPTPEEMEAGLLTLRDEGMKGVLLALLSSAEFQTY